MAIVLPTQKSEIDRTWEHQKFLMLGAGGIGKSSFWACGDKTLFLATEAGLNHLSVYKVELRSWDDFREAYGAMVQAVSKGEFIYDTVVVDTLDRLMSLMQEEIIRRGKEKFPKNEINSIGDIPNGVGWFWSDQMIDSVLIKLEELPAAVVLIGHMQNKHIETDTQKFDKDTINIGGKTGGRILHWPDHTMMVYSRMVGQKLERMVRTRPAQSHEGKSRGDIIPDGWAWGPDNAENYKKLRGLFS